MVRSGAEHAIGRSAFRLLLRSLPEKALVEEIMVQRALQHLQKQFDARSGYAANKDRKNLSRAWSWGSKMLEGFPQLRNPFLAVERFPEERAPRYVPSEEDFRKVLSLVKGQDRVMLLTFLHLGARRGEVFSLTWSDVDFEKKQIVVRTRKTRDGSWKQDLLPMTGELMEALQWWRDTCPVKSEHVFVCVNVGTEEAKTPQFHNQYGLPFTNRQTFMRKWCQRAGVKPFGFHAIRHLSATILYKGGHSVSLIQRILRHESATTTERYLKSLGFTMEDVRAALEVFSRVGQEEVPPPDNLQRRARVIPFAQEKTLRAVNSEG